MRILLSTILSLTLAGTAFAGTHVAADAIQARIADAITARAPAPGRYKVALSDQDVQLDLPSSTGGKWQISNLYYVPNEQSFRASISYVNDLGNPETLNITGSAYPVVTVPALAHDMLTGETIAQTDLTSLDIPTMRLGASMVTTADAVVGQVARRNLRAQSPLYAFDVAKPVLVKKGDLVSITFEMPGIQLSAQGQAQGNGGRGDVVSFMNTTSRRMVDARITGAGTAVVTSPTATLAAVSN